MRGSNQRVGQGGAKSWRRGRSGLGLSLALGLSLVACTQPVLPGWSGYVEGEALYLAAPVAGRLVELQVQKGQTVQAGAASFRLDNGAERALGNELQARERGAQAQALDARAGQRLTELQVLEAQLKQAQIRLQQTQDEWRRQQQLAREGYGLQARLDDAALGAREAQARLDELQARLRVAQLPAREHLQEAVQSSAAAAGFSRMQAQWRLDQLQQTAPQTGVVTTVLYRVGEWVDAGRPVLAILPPQARKARFFVPQSELARLPLGTKVQLSCDGCGEPIPARVSFVASQPEYTPPVIYSNAQRSKLMFLLEAEPERLADAPRLHPGQPIDVRPVGRS
ncbi:HlyD family secretion protein [Inhella proteolytica]|uniref:HlyD family efflux transporter periplasmic adaptor subunit n=1 Tax=Inhella proteolytica TaxID=2795029 RepID=A0A931J8E4_9BURK|nr:HlyD family efflux transporter periplasmic adaptor subunit [Inhella proteolytica]MBH9578682.1 HlyD family efflux transporter periplasmic adaptor subunit [Inhella proteolytica]